MNEYIPPSQPGRAPWRIIESLDEAARMAELYGLDRATLVDVFDPRC